MLGAGNSGRPQLFGRTSVIPGGHSSPLGTVPPPRPRPPPPWRPPGPALREVSGGPAGDCPWLNALDNPSARIRVIAVLFIVPPDAYLVFILRLIERPSHLGLTPPASCYRTPATELKGPDDFRRIR